MTTRLRSLDVFRGITIFWMMLANSPGMDPAYGFLEHAEWHGCTLTDLVFPFFIFILGVAVPFAVGARREAGVSQRDLWIQLLKRTFILILLGWILNGFPKYHLSVMRIPGVLPRIALAYFGSAAIYLWKGPRASFWGVLVLTLGYWLAMLHIPVPGYGAGNLTAEGNLAAYIDRFLMAGHLYRPHYDPEGLLSTLPAIATALIGICTGDWLRNDDDPPAKKAASLFVVGIAMAGAGWLWRPFFPINKALWTSSYVFWTAGLALAALAVLYVVVELRGRIRWARPFEVLGRNAILIYFLSILFLKIQNRLPMALRNGDMGNVRTAFTDHVFLPFMRPENASLAYGLLYTFIWLGIAWWLDRRRLYIRV